MAVVSPPLQASAWTFSTITNNYERRVASRKRVHDTVYEGGKQTKRGGSNKKAKTVQSIEIASHDARAPHEFLAGEWKFEPLCEDTTPTEIYLEEDAPSPEPLDVEKVMFLLLQALNAQSADNRSENQNQNQNKPSKPHHRYVTSPLSGSPDRVPLVRKMVGGPCRGRVDPGLQRWVLCKNHYDDICAYHPSRRSADWIEALHEMGWENLHPTYMSQSQQTFRTLTAFSASCDDWIDTFDAQGKPNGDGLDKTGSDGYHGGGPDVIHEGVWNLGLQVPSQRMTSIAA